MTETPVTKTLLSEVYWQIEQSRLGPTVQNMWVTALCNLIPFSIGGSVYMCMGNTVKVSCKKCLVWKSEPSFHHWTWIHGMCDEKESSLVHVFKAMIGSCSLLQHIAVITV